MSKADLKLQLKEFQEQIDSLINENKSLNEKVDSLQQAMNDSIAKFHNIMSQEPSLEESSESLQASDWGALLFIALLCIILAIVMLWAIWRFFRPSQCREEGFLSFLKKRWWIIPLLFVGWWLIILYWQWCLFIAAVLILTYGVYRIFKKKTDKSMIDKNLTVNWEDDSSFSSKNKENSQPVKVVDSPCIAAVSSDTRKAKNQDGFSEAFVQGCNARIIAIADGVGSSYKSEVGSHFVTEKAVELVKMAVEADEHHIDFDKIFDEIQDGLDKKVESDFAEELSELKPSSFGTTLIIGIDFPDRFISAYVGNGSIWHVSGYFNKFPTVVSLPWNAVNLLNPDTTMVGGKEALYKIFFYKGQKKNHKPTILQISKLREAPGDLFILTTDGVYSSDHAIASKDEEGDIWVPSTAQYGLLYELLKGYVESNEEISDNSLKAKIDTYLAHINEAQIMDDDTTLGIFISTEAKAHFMEERMKNETN